MQQSLEFSDPVSGFLESYLTTLLLLPAQRDIPIVFILDSLLEFHGTSIDVLFHLTIKGYGHFCIANSKVLFESRIIQIQHIGSMQGIREEKEEAQPVHVCRLYLSDVSTSLIEAGQVFC